MSRTGNRLILVCAVAVALLLAPIATAQAKKSCKSAGSRTVLANSKARIFKKKKGPGFRYYGCLKKLGKRWLLATDPGEADFNWSFNLPRLAGKYAAFNVYNVNSAGEGGGSVYVYNLVNGHEVTARADVPPGATGDPVEWYTNDLELTTGGFIAWIVDASFADAAVQSVDSTGSHVLDTGNIASASLELTGSTASWTKDGVPASAVLS